ncbi:ADP-ribosylglycohydrolase family protein [Frigidibacter sp. ROC022]|uniref:ADP-ribosylglycohydrolase family protein n=1 Tax=Frigidibacter sp. ROC022 TaxID=2971796 RepID=UPI00215B5518|nr:ADP-ribosylglycohydrolase family protein [Frigidibacter sp. ROC022]MCR8723492.1 ADP-ribosylglycohydrolase family protein [Frigidibacter sp. ROC022]
MALTRARYCLLGLAAGDALGMPAQTLSRERIKAEYGRITDFVAPYEGHPVSHGLAAGQVTDDTEQALLLARRLVADPRGFDEEGWARDLLAWEAEIRAKGLSDLLGPSSKAAIAALLEGTPPDRTGVNGTTNGAAMRIAPVGLSVPPEVDRLVARVVQTCRVTHNTGEAIAAASAVAMVVSCGVAGMDFNQALPRALEAASAGQKAGHPKGEPDMAGQIVRAVELAGQGEDALIEGIGTSVASRESVAYAFGLLSMGAPLWDRLVAAANAGDDTDTIGAIAGAMGGALGWSLPEAAVARLRAANALDLDGLAEPLIALQGVA